MSRSPRARLLLSIFPLAATAACLEIPPPAPATDGGTDAAGDAGDRAACGERSSFNELGDLQSLGDDLDLRDGVVADLNRDGVDDLVLYNPDAAKDRVVYVLLGPLASPSPAVHQRLTTAAVPYGVHVTAADSDLDGDGCPDLVVFGTRAQDPTEGFVEIYLNGAGAAATPLSTDPIGVLAPLVPEPSGPVLVTSGIFEGDAVIDLALSDLSHLYLVDLTGDGASSLPTAGTRELFGSELMSINGLLPYPSRDDAAVDDLLIVENSVTHWVERDASAGLSVRTPFDNTGLFTIRTLTRLDLDGDGDGDVIGGSVQTIGAWVVTNKAGTAVAVDFFEFGDPGVIASEGLLDVSALISGELDATPGPELVVLDYRPTGGSNALLLQNLRVMGAAIEPSSGTNLVFSGFNPRLGFALDADADADLDVYVIDPTTGEGRCLEVSGADLIACN